MQVDLAHLLAFPKNASEATTGVFFPEDNLLVTGHDNGVVFLWNLSGGSPRKLYECSTKIETVTASEKQELAIGSHSGEIVVLSIERPGYTIVQPAAYGVRNRVWRSLWLQDDAFITSSTYGLLNVFRKEADSKWTKNSLSGHENSVFGVGRSDRGLLTTGDYFGKILIWNLGDGGYETIQRLKIQNAVEDIAWFKDEAFAAINNGGGIYLFEQDSERRWRSVFEVRNATSRGNCVNITPDGKTVFAATNSEVIQFDIETRQIDSMRTGGVKKIFFMENNVFLLTSYGLVFFERKPIELRADLIKYKYVKTGIVGHTGVGKSTLCSFVTTGLPPADYLSTVGKKIWNWELPVEENLQRRIVFHDHGGQETVLGTFLPFLSDSDVVLILFQQNDLVTFEKAIKIFEKIKNKVADRVKIFFVQTHIDQKMAELNTAKIEKLVERGELIDNLKVCPKDGKGIEDLKERLTKEISWNNARIMIQTLNADAVLRCIVALQEKNIGVIQLSEFIKYYEESTNLRIPRRHLEFLLKDYSNQGIIEYYPEILDSIIFNDPEYNSLKTEIPIEAMKRNGIVKIGDLAALFKNGKFLQMIDKMYLKHKVWIENGEWRIFPELLKDEAIEIPKHLIKFFENISTEKRLLPDQMIDIGRLIEALFELKLQCIDASKKDGLFSWKEHALIYYSFERIGNAIDGFSFRCNYRIGGMKKQICKRLQTEFLNVLEQLYGPFIKGETLENKKKANLDRDIVHDVAISYATEQGEYAGKVADILRENGIDVFFDGWNEAKMWGRDLAEYLMRVYYRQSKYCMMFISKDYVSKAWPTYERKMAIARNIEQFGGYILPIRFDESEVPGLPPTVRYINGNNKTPEEVADVFIEKLEEEEDKG